MRLPGIDKLERATWAGTFEVLYTLGFAGPIVQTWTFLRTGLQITVYPTSQVLAPSTSVFFSSGAGAFPEEARPARLAMFPVAATDNSVGVNGMILFNAANGAVALGTVANSTLINNWTAANNKGFPVSATASPQFTYMGAPLQ